MQITHAGFLGDVDSKTHWFWIFCLTEITEP
jgi:hypothetical protein